jgi:hypothetical protein
VTKSEKETARRELMHALDALGDGAGRDMWGPGSVGVYLVWRNRLAAYAFDTAAQVAWSFRKREAAICAATMRKIAPVLLDILLEDQ